MAQGRGRLKTPEALGRYRIQQELGRGGMGSVYKALDPSLDRIVAIKTIKVESGPSGERFLHRLVEEARATARLSHPNIVNVYDIVEERGQAFIVMEYVEGITLDYLMVVDSFSDYSSALQILTQCASALDYAHSQNILHRDVKPGNIMVRPDRVVKMLDFGLALTLNSASRFTDPGFMIGTIGYIAPEAITGDELGPPADQFTLATIAFTLLTGRNPFAAENVAAQIAKIVYEEPISARQLNPNLSEAADATLKKALSKRSGDRFLTCTEFIAALGGDLALGPEQDRTATKGTLHRFFSFLRGISTGKPEPQSIEPDQPRMVEARAWESAQTQILRRPVDQRLEPDVLAHWQAIEMFSLAQRRDFQAATDLRGKWLPGVQAAEPELLGFSDAARYLAAAGEVASPHNRLEHLNRAHSILIAVGNRMLTSASPLSKHLPAALEAWKKLTRELIQEASELAVFQVPNPFRAGQPLRPDQGPDLFRGREPLIRQIEEILADTNHLGSMALLGPRRCGKTSLLQMLPAMLPDCVCVFFDLQDNPVSSVSSFFQALSRQTTEQARRQRGLQLPEIAGEATFESAALWLRDLDEVCANQRILICLDEFERLEHVFPGDQRDLLRLMGLLRATIQHRRRVRLLVSGVAPFEELGPLWNDHFINVRELRIGHLNRETSINLIRLPIPEFPKEAVPVPVAEEIYVRTGGQPYLLQLYGSLLVGRLNEESRCEAVIQDVAAVEEQALTQGVYYFRNTFNDAREDARRAMHQLSLGQDSNLTSSTRRWLQGRWLIDSRDRLTVPVLVKYIRETTE